MRDRLLFLLLTVSFVSSAVIPETTPNSFKNESTSPTPTNDHYNVIEIESLQGGDSVEMPTTALPRVPDTTPTNDNYNATEIVPSQGGDSVEMPTTALPRVPDTTPTNDNYNVTEIVSSQGGDSVEMPTTALPRVPDTTTAGKECITDVQTSFMDLKIDGKKFRYTIIEEIISMDDSDDNVEEGDQTRFVGNDNEETVRRTNGNERESKRVRRQYRIFGMFGLPRDKHRCNANCLDGGQHKDSMHVPLDNYERYRYTVIKLEDATKRPKTTTAGPKPTTTLRPFHKQKEKDVMDPIQKYNQDHDPFNLDHVHHKRDTAPARTGRKKTNGIKFLVWGGELKNLTDEHGTGGSECVPDLFDEKLFESMSFACLWMKITYPNKISYSIIGTGMPKQGQYIQELSRELCSDHNESTPNDDIGSIKKPTNDFNMQLPNLNSDIGKEENSTKNPVT